jgi:hypothetical protein
MLSAPSARADRAFGSTRRLKVVRREPMFWHGSLILHAVRARSMLFGHGSSLREIGDFPRNLVRVRSFGPGFVEDV